MRSKASAFRPSTTPDMLHAQYCVGAASGRAEGLPIQRQRLCRRQASHLIHSRSVHLHIVKMTLAQALSSTRRNTMNRHVLTPITLALLCAAATHLPGVAVAQTARDLVGTWTAVSNINIR